MENLYSELFLIPDEKVSHFENDKKNNLSLIEKVGLEAMLADFIAEYEEIQYGEAGVSIKEYTRWNDNCVDILDGYTDTYIFDHYAIGSVWTTSNGCVCMDAVDLEEYTGDDKEAFEDSDLYDRPSRFDIWSDFKPVLFRLY